MTAGLHRRGFLAGVGLVGAGAVAAGSLAACSDGTTDSGDTGDAGVVAFHGPHQAGIATAAQDRLAFASFDLTTNSRDDLIAMLRTWTEAAAAMTLGQPVPGDSTSLEVPPADTGEAMGLKPADLTVTIGFGPSMFDGRFGLRDRMPAALNPLPHLPGDLLRPAISNGDIAVQCCSNDPQVAFHAMRNLARLARGSAVLRWSQLGFGRTSSTTTAQATPRNLMGFKDGTRNVKGNDLPAMDDFVWVGDETDQDWMRGGSYVVARRIRMLIESWDRDFLGDQQDVIGRFKDSGAPLTGKAEFDEPDFAATRNGQKVIPMDAHVRLASPEENENIHILRRGYSFTDGVDAATGQLDAGLFFIAYQKNAHEQFVPLQRKLGRNDALNEYIKHVSSGLWACPPGVAQGEYWGQALFTQ